MNNNKRWIGVVSAVLLAAIGTFVLVQYVSSADERALAGQETIEVLVVNQAVAAGTPAEELAATVDTALVPARTQVPGSVASLEQLSGTVAAVDLVPGEQLLLSRFIEPAGLRVPGRVRGAGWPRRGHRVAVAGASRWRRAQAG